MPVLLVTGGSRGIGAALARRAAHAGYDVAFTYASEEARAAEVVRAVEDAGRRAVAIRSDAGIERDVVAAFAQLDTTFGTPDALVINAGITGGFGRVDELDGATLARVLEINVAGAFFAAREAVRRMSTLHGGRGGAIVAVSSRAATLGSPGEYVQYAASKAALNTLVVGLAKEIAREGVRVNAVAPGLIDTEIHARAGRPDRPVQLAPAIPMGRVGTPDEVVEAIMWLCSDAASYVTGAILDVGGGR